MSTIFQVAAGAGGILAFLATISPQAVPIGTAPEAAVVSVLAADSQDPIGAIARVAAAHGIEPEHLLAVSAQESSLGKFRSGDEGCSRGWFHINLCANPEAALAIGDVSLEAAWAAGKLASYGYAESSTLAFARYNAPAAPNYAYAALVVGRIPQVMKLLQDRP